MKYTKRIALSLAVFALACGPTEDPSKNNGTSSNNGGTNNGTTAPNNGTTAPNNGTTAPNNGTTTAPNNGTTTAPNNGTTDPNNGTVPFTCELDPDFYGQINNSGVEHGGGAPTMDALTTDAGIQAALAAFTAMEDMTQTVDLQISGATVTAVGDFGADTSNFWIQDANGAMQVFLGFDNPTSEPVAVGDKISFKITEMGNFSGHPQIQALTDLSSDETGTAVPYLERTGVAFEESDYNKIVRVSGTVVGGGEACGGSSKCWQIDTGNGNMVELRTRSEFVEIGGCLTNYVGPLGSFPGPYNDTDAPVKWQLNAATFDWFYVNNP